MTQFLIEEAAWLSLDVAEMNSRREEVAREASEAEAEATHARLEGMARDALRRARGAI